MHLINTVKLFNVTNTHADGNYSQRIITFHQWTGWRVLWHQIQYLSGNEQNRLQAAGELHHKPRQFAQSDSNTGSHSDPAVPSLRIYPREVDKSAKAEQYSSQLYLESQKTGKRLNMKKTLLKESQNIHKILCHHENQPHRKMCEGVEEPLWYCTGEEGVTKPKQLWVKQLTCFLLSSLCLSVFQFPPMSMH